MTAPPTGAERHILHAVAVLASEATPQALADHTGFSLGYVQRTCRNLCDQGTLIARTTDVGWVGTGRKPRIWALP